MHDIADALDECRRSSSEGKERLKWPGQESRDIHENSNVAAGSSWTKGPKPWVDVAAAAEEETRSDSGGQVPSSLIRSGSTRLRTVA